MDPVTIQESPIAGKGGETTAVAPSAASERINVDFTSDGMAKLLASDFAAPETLPVGPGQEVQPETGSDDLQPPALPPDESADPVSPENPENPEHPESTDTTARLPEQLQAELNQWEQQGGTLPASLQKLVDRRIGKVVGEREAAEARAETAEAKLKAQLETQPEVRPPGAVLGSEQELTAKILATKKFLKDARPFVGGYATDEQRERLQKFMADNRMDENSLHQVMDEVSDWMTHDAPQQLEQVRAFKQAEHNTQPMLKARFASLARKDSPEAETAAEIMRLVPELKVRTPAHGLAIGTYVLGQIAAEHLLAATKDGDVIEMLKGILHKHVPLPLNGKTRTGALPGKAPLRTAPMAGSPPAATRINGRETQAEQASQLLRENPTAENVMNSLRIALR